MAAEIHFDHKMSDAEGLMWRLDKDPYLTSTFSNLSLLDRAPDLIVFAGAWNEPQLLFRAYAKKCNQLRQT
jgi:choline dehydrogenase-like flavoprotein